MKSITEYVIKLQKLTQQNLDILTALNDAFFTRQNHLSVSIGDEQYAIPSFISLENKLNTLTENFNNLVHAPESGEAFFNIDGNSRAIQVRSYTSVPNSLVLAPVNKYGFDNTDIFKDFMTPIPYINVGVQSLPNDITQVLMKKIIPIHNDLVSFFQSQLGENQPAGSNNTGVPSVQYAYKDLYKILSSYKQDEDYIEYESKLDLPIRKNIGSGIYVIESIIDDWVDDNLINYITLKLRSDMKDPIYMNALKYRLFDETIEKMLRIGDKLLTFEGNAKMEITEIRSNTNTITVKVESGEFLNLVPSSSNNPKQISSLSKIKFFSPINFDEDKYLKIPLEEDKYVFVAVAALNNRMNVQSPWGGGLMINTYKLLNGETTFDKYYKENVRNVGDVLFEITSMMSNTLTGHSKSEYEELVNLTPIVDTNNLLVTQINKHLNDSVAVQNIRSLYSQKKNLQSQLKEIEVEIGNINDVLATVSFDDTTGVRTSYVSQLTSLNSKKNELTSAIEKTTNDISLSANSSEVPIENAKYRIRGFFDYTKFLTDLDKSQLISHIRGIRVQYRYKNVDQEQGNAMSINDKFVFSDWNDMDCFDRQRVSEYDNGYKFHIENNNDKVNEPSFNQIDIPISQGETVDIRLKLVYDFGWPFIYTYSNWSPIINISFPEEYLKDVKILDIISENNNDVESNRFNNIIKAEGVPDHIGDKIIDQDITYYHKPENIASGFYTAERRIIPLKDKLTALDTALLELKDIIYGESGESIKVSIKHGSSQNDLLPYQIQNIAVEPYNSLNINEEDSESFEGLYDINNGEVSTVLNISLYNDSNHTVKLFSLFPGNRDEQIANLLSKKYDKSSYCKTNGDVAVLDNGIWMEYPGDSELESTIQGGNQFVYFRINDVNTGSNFYQESQLTKDGFKTLVNGSTAYPKLSDKYSLCLDASTPGTYLTLGPNEEILIPIVFIYKLNGENESTYQTISFEILPSLYKDPIPYTFRINAKYSATSQDKVIMTNKKKFRSWWGGKDVNYKTTFK